MEGENERSENPTTAVHKSPAIEAQITPLWCTKTNEKETKLRAEEIQEPQPHSCFYVHIALWSTRRLSFTSHCPLSSLRAFISASPDQCTFARQDWTLFRRVMNKCCTYETQVPCFERIDDLAVIASLTACSAAEISSGKHCARSDTEWPLLFSGTLNGCLAWRYPFQEVRCLFSCSTMP